MNILIDECDRAIVRAILAQHLTDGIRVRVFGSRAGGRPRRVSDLDLLLEGNEPISTPVMADLRDAFDESDLPWKVDLVDRAAISDAFAKAIEADLVPLDGS